MKFTIAAKLGLLAALVSLLATGLLGWWSLREGRKVLTDHELVDLTDETELRLYELMNDFRYLRKDLRDISNPQVKLGESAGEKIDVLKWVECLCGTKGAPASAADQEEARLGILKRLERLLAQPENYYYLELTCLRVDARTRHLQGRPLLAVGRRHNHDKVQSLKSDPNQDATEPLLGVRQTKALDTLLESPRTVRNPRHQLFPIQAQRVTGGGTDRLTPMLLTTAFPVPSRQTDANDPPLAVLVLTIDFEEFVRFRARHLPRHLLWLADDAGRLLFHPDPHKQSELRQASSKGLDHLPPAAAEPPLNAFAKQFERKNSVAQQEFRKERGAGVTDIKLPGMSFNYAMQRFGAADRAQMEKHWKEMRLCFEALLVEHPRLRFYVPAASSNDLQISCPDRASLKAVQEALLTKQRELGWNAPSWQSPVVCETFAVRFMQLNPDLDARDKLWPDADPHLLEEKPRFFGVALATGLEEIHSDIDRQLTGFIWGVLVLAALAAGSTWLASRMLTRPLEQIIRATESIAAGTVDGALPEPLPIESRDEIGVLARSFENMREQLRRRREAIVENANRMRSILDTAAEGIVIFDDHGVIESFNQAAEHIFGWSAAEIHTQKVSVLMDAPPRAAGDVPIPGESMRIVSQVVKTRGEVVGRRRDGSTFPMEVAFSEVPLQGRTVVTGIFRDITERKRAEAEIRRANEELEGRVKLRTEEVEQAMLRLETMLQGAVEASKAKDDFMAKVSHELRTPLNAIIGYSELLIELGQDDGDVRLVADLMKILTAGRHLNDLISDILEFRAFLEGKLRLVPAEFRMAQLIDTIRSLADPLASKYGNRLVFDIAGDLGTAVNEAKRLKQVLLNLLSNACKFTDQGTVTFRARREVDAEGGEWFLFAVQDTGPGMTPEQMKKLFTPYYRVDAEELKTKPGTGLGLAISKSFCEMMGGGIAVASEKGNGSTFTVRIPVVVQARQAEPTAARATTSMEAARWSNVVLIIDDDMAARDTIARHLIRDGLAVQMADSGEQGLRLAKELRPAAITLDVQMPGMDGWAVLAGLKSDPATADIPVIMLTIEDNARRGFSLGASDYLTKPIDWERLANVLHRYCRGSQSAPVMVVEDNEVSRTLLTRMLLHEGSGRKVIAAENGRVALERLQQGPKPSLILLDLMMPEMNGFEFLEELRQRPEFHDVPVVVVTAKELTDEDRRRLNGSVASILSKTAFTSEELLDQLRARVREHVRPS